MLYFCIDVYSRIKIFVTVILSFLKHERDFANVSDRPTSLTVHRFRTFLNILDRYWTCPTFLTVLTVSWPFLSFLVRIRSQTVENVHVNGQERWTVVTLNGQERLGTFIRPTFLTVYFFRIKVIYHVSCLPKCI